jgi:hypothetical protein
MSWEQILKDAHDALAEIDQYVESGETSTPLERVPFAKVLGLRNLFEGILAEEKRRQSQFSTLRDALDYLLSEDPFEELCWDGGELFATNGGEEWDGASFIAASRARTAFNTLEDAANAIENELGYPIELTVRLQYEEAHDEEGDH